MAENRVDTIYQIDHFQVEVKLNTYVKATSESDSLRNPKDGKQAILFMNYMNTNEIKKNFPKLKFREYCAEIDLKEREEIRNGFKKGDFQFLLATPNMYALNKTFKKFVHDQIQNKEILIGVEIWNEDRHGINPELATLKKTFPDQQWIVFTDYIGDELKTMLNDVHLYNANVENLFINDIYLIKDLGNIFSSLRYSMVSSPTRLQGKQAIMFTSHFRQSATFKAEKLKEVVDLQFREYKDQEQELKRVQIRQAFISKKFDVLLPSYFAYKSDKAFKEFVHDQIRKKNIVIALGIQENETLAPTDHLYPELPSLKKAFPRQKWIFLTDCNDDSLKIVLEDFQMDNAKVTNLRHMY